MQRIPHHNTPEGGRSIEIGRSVSPPTGKSPAKGASVS